jgi:glutathione S-transferase
MNVFGLTTMRAFMPRDLAAFPNIRSYLKRIGERPAYRRAMAKGDPDLAPMLD